MTKRDPMMFWPFYEFTYRRGRWLLTLDAEDCGYLAFSGDSKADCWQAALKWLSQRPRHNTAGP